MRPAASIAGRLDVPVRVRRDPHVPPGRRDDQLPQPGQLVRVAHRLARPGRRRASPCPRRRRPYPGRPGSLRRNRTADPHRPFRLVHRGQHLVDARAPPASGGFLPRPSGGPIPRRRAQSTRCRGRSGGGPQRAGGTGPKSTTEGGAVAGGQVGDAGVPADHQPGVRRPARPARPGRSGRRAPPSGGSPARRGHPRGQRPARRPSRSPPPGAPARPAPGPARRTAPAASASPGPCCPGARTVTPAGTRPAPGRRRARSAGSAGRPYQCSSRHQRCTSCSSSSHAGPSVCPAAGLREGEQPARAGGGAAAGATAAPGRAG